MAGIQDGNGLMGGEGGVGFTLSDGNGTTANGSKCDLGGDVIQDTALTFDPSEYYISFGDTDNANGFYYGNIVGDGDVYLGSDGANVVSFYAESGTNFYLIGTSLDDGTGFPTVDLNVVNDDVRYGFYAFDNSGKKTSKIYYALWDGAITTDISRIEANEDEVHGRHLIDPTGVLPNYNGFYANATYTQLEFNKTAEDGQTTGNVWVLDADGASMFKDGVKVFRIKNSVPSYADDAAAAVGGLTTGDVYKTTTSGSTFLKIVP